MKAWATRGLGAVVVALDYLLETNVLLPLMREPSGATAEHLARVGDAAVCTSVVVASELRFGAMRRGSPRLIAAVDRILRAITILPLSSASGTTYINRIRVRHRGCGHGSLGLERARGGGGVALARQRPRGLASSRRQSGHRARRGRSVP